jgi:hypothetical protein
MPSLGMSGQNLCLPALYCFATPSFPVRFMETILFCKKPGSLCINSSGKEAEYRKHLTFAKSSDTNKSKKIDKINIHYIRKKRKKCTKDVAQQQT